MSILDRFRLDGRVAIVTGAGRGIGRACALAFADAGADVVVSSRTEDELRVVADEVADRGRAAEVVTADLDETGNLQALVDRAAQRFGRLDVVVNNVGGTLPRAFLDTSEGFLERAFHFNVTTAFSLTKRAVPLLLESENAVVVNVSSAMGRLRDRGYLAYGTSKAALAHLTRLAAADLAPRIRVNAIAVGSVLTSALDVVAQDDDLRGAMEQATPLRRLGAPDDIAAAALYLASPAGAWVTGKVLEVDGGIEEPNLDLGLPDVTMETRT